MNELSANERQKSKSEMMASICRLEEEMKARPDIQIEIEPRHYFAPGLYLREITIPMGVCLTGKIHKTEHLCILSKGRVSVWTDEGMKTLEASSVVHSLPGIKRVLYAHEESVWINCHFNPENISDLEKIESHYVAETLQELLEFKEKHLLERSGDPCPSSQ